jgi:56kDa selenium binding protein (SBP56).
MTATTSRLTGCRRRKRGRAGAEFADGYGYDARAAAEECIAHLVVRGLNNYMRPFGDMAKDPEAMKQFGGSMVLWDFHTRQPKKVFNVPGVPLEIRWAWGENHNYAFTATALTSKLWLCYEDKNGEWQAKEVATIGGEGGVLPADISLSADDTTLFVDCFADGKCRVFDVSNPQQPKQIYEKQIGKQLNMVSQSWDGKAALLQQFAARALGQEGRTTSSSSRAYGWDGKELTRSLRSTSPRSNSAARTTCSSVRRRWGNNARKQSTNHKHENTRHASRHRRHQRGGARRGQRPDRRPRL